MKSESKLEFSCRHFKRAKYNYDTEKPSIKVFCYGVKAGGFENLSRVNVCVHDFLLLISGGHFKRLFV